MTSNLCFLHRETACSADDFVTTSLAPIEFIQVKWPETPPPHIFYGKLPLDLPQDESLIERLVDNIRSLSPEAQRGAAQEVLHHGYYAPEILDALRDQLLITYRAQSLNSHQVDAGAWMIKALATSGNPDYKSALIEIRDATYYKKLKKYAKKTTKKYMP